MLQKTEGVYQRVDYLIEYAQWLKVSDFPLDDTLDILEWASDLLLNMKTAESRPGTCDYFLWDVVFFYVLCTILV